MHLFKPRTPVLLTVLSAALLLIPGCRGAADSGGLFAFLDSPAEFTVAFPPLDETALPVVCRASLSPEEISFSVEEPARSRGLSVTYRNGRCTIEPAEGVPVPLSEQAAEPLTAFCLVLTEGPSGRIRLSDDGDEILSEENGGVLHLTPDGVPTAVESPASDGILRTSVIGSWTEKEASPRIPNQSQHKDTEIQK